MQTGTSPQGSPAGGEQKQQTYIIWGAVILAVAAIAASFFVIRNATANADYICTHVTEENGDCTNGNWGAWGEVSSTEESCVVTKLEKRVYTGSRTTRHILQYLNLRTACEGGYAQSGSGSGGGASGFHGGTIITESAACQIEEVRTTRKGSTANTCSATQMQMAPEVTVTKTQSDINALDAKTASVSAVNQLTAFRESMISAKIFVNPPLVRRNATTLVKWQGVEVTDCTVTGSNGDTWPGTSGERTSSPITVRTVYTLSCTAFNGATVTDEATVNITPVFREI